MRLGSHAKLRILFASALALAGGVPAVAQEVAPVAPEVTAEEPAQPADAPNDEAEAEDLLPEEWPERVEWIARHVEQDEAARSQADALYDELMLELDAKRRYVTRSILRWRDGVDELYVEVEDLYAVRTALLPSMSEEKHNDITGVNLQGFNELLDDFERVALHISYQTRALPLAIPRILAEQRADPLPALGRILLFAIALVLFFRWRRWAPRGIPALRERFLRATPRQPYHLRVARLLWYTAELRRPVEWLALLSLLFLISESPETDAVVEPIWVVARWVIFAALAVGWINAMAKRRSWNQRSESGPVRLRSLRLVATWIVLLGLGVDISHHYTGEGTLYAWTWAGFSFLAAPIAALLLFWWRPHIFARLDRDVGKGSRSEQLLQHRGGLRGYANALEGVFVLFFRGISNGVFRTLSSFDEGRSLMSLMLGREVGRSQRVVAPANSQPMPEEMVHQIQTLDASVVESVARRHVSRLVAMAQDPLASTVMISGDRGAGKSRLLARIADSIPGRMATLACQPGGSVHLREEFARVFDLKPHWSPADLDSAIAARGIRVVGVDDMHYLVRPVMGGQAGSNELRELVRSLDPGLFWCGTADRRAWQQMLLARGDNSTTGELVQLDDWSEPQISMLIEHRCQALGLQLDFSALVLPREVGEMSHVAADERVRHGFYRFICQSSGGNPGVALQHLSESLRPGPDGRYLAWAPRFPTADDLEALGLTQLLVLRTLLRYDRSSLDDLVEALRLPPAEVGNALTLGQMRGWVVEQQDRYRLAMHWLPAITRILLRKNLQSR